MHATHRRFHRPVAAAAALGLSLLVAACSIDASSFTGADAEVPPGTAALTVIRGGAAKGTVTSNPGGISCGASCSAAYPLGTAVTLTATPDIGATFAGWSGGGCTGAAPTCTVSLAAATSVTATFDLVQYLVTVELGGSGRGAVTVSGAGIACPGTCTAMVAHGTSLVLEASAGAASQFMGWTVSPDLTACAGTAIGDCAAVITGPMAFKATFAQLQALEVTRSGTGHGTVVSSPAGINCGADCSEIYLSETMVTLTATPAADSRFTGWSGACTGTGTCSVAMTSARMVTATFTLSTYPLSVTRSGTGTGTVSSSPAGISCGSSCSASYDHGTAVTLTAVPATGSTFAGWSGGGCSGNGSCTVAMTAAATVTATFTRNTYLLAVSLMSVSMCGLTRITSSVGNIDCRDDGTGTCSATYLHGSTVTLTMTLGPGDVFGGWTGACAGAGLSCNLTITSNTSTVGYADSTVLCLR